MSDWSAYYDHHASRAPRPLLAEAVAAVRTGSSPPLQAVDLGCGQGTETLALLHQGWRVFAVDAEPEAAERLRAAAGAPVPDRLTVVTAAFGDVTLPPCDLVWSALALPFCPPADFPAVWAHVRQSLLPGGVVACDLWGPRHAWAARGTTVTKQDVDHLLDGLEVLRCEEEEEDRETVLRGTQHWHAFAIVARRPRTS